MTDLITREQNDNALAINQQISDAMNDAARNTVFQRSISTASKNTQRSYRQGLKLFSAFMEDNAMRVGDLYSDPAAWTQIDFGLVEGFKMTLVKAGYSIESINRHVSTVKKFSALAFSGGTISAETAMRIAAVKTYSGKQAVNLNANRQRTRRTSGNGVNVKKSEPYLLSQSQVTKLKKITCQRGLVVDLRNCVALCLMVDQGLRVSDVVKFNAKNFDIDAGTIQYVTTKTNVLVRQKMTKSTKRALTAYLHYMPSDAPIMLAFNKSGLPTGGTVSEGVVGNIVKALGARVDAPTLSPHDFRHYRATLMATHGATVAELMAFFGWKSAQTAMRYVSMNDYAETVEID